MPGTRRSPEACEDVSPISAFSLAQRTACVHEEGLDSQLFVEAYPTYIHSGSSNLGKGDIFRMWLPIQQQPKSETSSESWSMHINLSRALNSFDYNEKDFSFIWEKGWDLCWRPSCHSKGLPEVRSVIDYTRYVPGTKDSKTNTELLLSAEGFHCLADVLIGTTLFSACWTNRIHFVGRPSALRA